MHLTRRHFLNSACLSLATACAGLLAACSSNSPAASTSAPAVGTPSGKPVIQPNPSPSPASSASPSASASPAAAASSVAASAPSPSAAPAQTGAAAPVAASNQPARQMYQQDAQHTGRSQFAGPRQANVLRHYDTSTPDNLPPDAAIPRDDFQSSSVVGADGTIYIANFPGVLFALRDSSSARDQLEVAWRFHPPMASSFHATPALSSDSSMLYLGFSAGSFSAPGAATLYALETASPGPQPQVVWSTDLGATRVMASPTVGPDGTIYVGTGGGQLFAVGADGRVKWTAQTGPTVKSAPALGSDGTVYHPSSDGKMYAVSPQGQVKWTFDFGEHLGPTPLLTSDQSGPGGAGGGASGVGTGASPTLGGDGTIFIGANNSNMYAVTPDGSLKWLFEAERELAGIWTTPALSTDGKTIYFGANKGGIYALNTADGSKRWQYPVYGSIFASSVLDNRGVLYTGTTIEQLYAVDSASGESIWDIDVRNEIWSAPAIRADGTVVIADRGGLVQVIG